MPALTDREIAQLAYEAGFRGDALRWAVAIAKAESGGNPEAYNPEISAGTVPGSGSRGLWQIYGTAHPRYNSPLAFQPEVNARAAFEVYTQAGNRFTPWSTFNNGMAASYYNSVNVGSPSGGSNPSGSNNRGHAQPNRGGTGYTGTGSGSSNPLATVSGQIQQTNEALQNIASGQFLSDWFQKFDKVSFSFYIGGILLIGIGLIVLFAKPAQEIVVNVAKTAATGGVAAVL